MITEFAGKVLRRGSVRRAKLFNELLPKNSRVLDLGASEGFVGGTLSELGHDVVLADVVDRNTTSLPFVVFDGENLPFEDDEFDAIVIVYVLHHARNADKLIQEALRVSSELLIIETVYERWPDRMLTTFLDHRVNSLRGMKPEPLDFDTPQGWIRRIGVVGGEVTTWRWLGRGLHRQILMRVSRRCIVKGF